jgi:hypothetical protein
MDARHVNFMEGFVRPVALWIWDNTRTVINTIGVNGEFVGYKDCVFVLMPNSG